jgi:CubicO group peptidase (beta-lactamase class C family)
VNRRHAWVVQGRIAQAWVLAALLGLSAPVAATAAAAQALAPARPEAVGVSAERLGRLQRAMQGFVDRGEVAGVVALVVRDGRVVALDTAGWLNVEARIPMRSGTIFRIASMSKPVTSVAIMMLYEEGRLLLSDPVARYLPEFRDMQVVAGADSAGGRLVRARRPITIHDLLTHRSGLSYGFLDRGPVGDAYRAAGISDGIAPDSVATVADNVARLAALPLLHQPGERWTYGLSVDVLGRVVEVVSGRSLADFLRERIFAPLRMPDTDFLVPEAKLARLAVPYTPADRGRLRAMARIERFGNLTLGGVGYRGSARYFSGGAGLASTARDYARFLQMLLNGGELDGVRLLGPKTVELMTVSHTADLSPSPLGPGTGFGLGFAVTTDLAGAEVPGSVGQYRWSGIYGTSFWVDPKERLVGVLMVQLFPSDNVPIDQVFQALTYQALTR